MSLETDLKEVIEKNMPAQIGNHLLERLKQADKDASELKRLTTQIELSNKNTAALKEELETHKTKLRLQESLDKQKEEQKEKDFELKLREAKVSDKENVLQHYRTDSYQIVQDIKDVVGMVFGNNILKRTIMREEHEYPKRDQYGNMIYPDCSAPTVREGPKTT